MTSAARVLLVDQDDSYRTQLAAELAEEGIATETAAGLRDALKMMQASDDGIDIVLVGKVGEQEMGAGILSELKSRYPAAEAVILHSQEEAPPNAISSPLGAPIRVDRLASGKIISSLIYTTIRYTAERNRNLDLRAMLSAAERVGKARDEEHLYQQLYQEASELLPGLDGFLIAHFDEQANEVSFPFSYSHGKRVHIQPRTSGNSIAEYVLLTKEPLYLPFGDEFFRLKHGLNPPDEKLGFCTSEIVIPMFLEGGKIYGAVFAASYDPAIHYTVEHLQILKTFSSQAAITIRNFIQIKEANQLRDATADLAGQRGREGVLRAIIQGAHKIVNSDFTGMILREEDGTLRKARPVIPESYYRKFGEPRQTGGLTRTIIESRQPMKIPDTAKNPVVKDSVRAAGIRSMLALPLIHADRVLGVLYTHTFKPRDYVGRDVALWSAFATQAASALDRVMEEERQIRDYQRLVRELDNLEEPLSLNETLARVATAAKKVFDSDSCRLFYIDPPTGTIVETAWADGDSGEYHIEGTPRLDGSTYHVLRTNKPYYYPDMTDGPEPRSELISAGLKSSASLPLRYGGRAIGVLHCNYFSKTPSFDEHFRTLHEAFGARAAVALSRVRRELRIGVWHTLAGEIINCTDVRQLYGLFTAKAHQALLADYSVFYPYDPTAAKAGRLPLEEDCVRIGARTAWRQPKGGMGGKVFQFIARRRPIMILNDLEAQRGRFRSHITEREGIKGYVALRLEVIQPGKNSPTLAGILFLNYRRVINFEENDLTGVRYASELIAAGILRLHLQEDLRRAFEQRNYAFEQKNRQLSAMIDIFRDHESKSKAPNLNHIAERAGKSLGIDSITILEFDSISGRFTNRGEYGLLHPEFRDINPRPSFKDEYMHKVGPTVIVDVKKDRIMKLSKFVKREGIRSTVIYPLRAEGELLGLFFCNYRQPTQPIKEDLVSIGLFADVAAHVLHQAKLNTQLIEKQLKEDRHRLLVWFSMVEDMWQHNLVQKASAIRNYAQTVQRQLEQQARLPAVMKLIPERITEIDRLAADIANAPPRVPLETEMRSELIPIGPLLLEIADRERRSLRLNRDKHRIEVDVKALGGVQVSGYRRWLIFIFENLFLNSYAAMPHGGQITITGTKQKSWAEIRIRDTGRGVPKHLRDKIFRERFTGRRKHKGLGVGTILVTTLVEENQGSIKLEKPGPGDTTVLIRLPIFSQTKIR